MPEWPAASILTWLGETEFRAEAGSARPTNYDAAFLQLSDAFR
jgi:hypothetical protein